MMFPAVKVEFITSVIHGSQISILLAKVRMNFTKINMN